jgi:hypothetical protein
VLNIAFHKLLLVEDFKGNNEFGFLLTSKVNMAELATAQRLTNFKIIYGPVLRSKLLVI